MSNTNTNRQTVRSCPDQSGFSGNTKTLFLLAAISICFIATAFSQAPGIEWQNTIGGSKDDFLMSLQPTSDGGYIAGGYSYSGISGDKTEDKLSDGLKPDYWVIKLNSTGSIVWQNTIGGNETDHLNSIAETSDGGYIIGGYSSSDSSGDKTETPLGSYNYWVVKLNSDGSIEWENTIAGDGSERLYSAQQTSDGGYIIGGYTDSGISGDKTEASQGGIDYWVVKLNSTGTIEWQNTIGGNGNDELHSIQQTTDDGYILGGSSWSGISGDKAEGNLGYTDYWVVKLNSIGAIEWQNTIGGSEHDELYSIQQTSDGGYIIGGYSRSDISADKTEDNLGESWTTDYWVVKLSSTGTIEWDNTMGGSEEDEMYPIQQTSDGGYILGGWSDSGISGDKTEATIGAFDLWVVKLYSTGAIEWQNTIGGTESDGMRSIEQTSDGGFIIGGYSWSDISGDKAEIGLGSSDYWVVKLYPEVCDGIIVYADADSDGYGDAANSYLAADCIIPSGYVNNNIDCNDSNSSANPLGTEVCNNLVDEDCNGIMDDCVCTDPASPDEAAITSTAVILHWDAVTGAEGNRIRYKTGSLPGWTTKSASSNFKKITGLTPGTHYAWQVKTICSAASGNTSNWTATRFFTTNSLKPTGGIIAETFEVYPNPFSSSTNITFSIQESSNIIIELFDMAGRKLETLLDENMEAGSHEVNLARGHLPVGIYVLKMKTASSVTTEAIIIQ